IPDTVPLTRGSRGCVVVRNNIIKQLKNYVKLKETPILIFDQIKYGTAEEHQQKKQEIESYLDSWKTAWQSQKIDSYMNFYDPSFTAPGFDFEGWKKHKSGLKYQFVKVDILNPLILTHKDQLYIKFIQKYQSDLHKDEGIKTIYALKNGSTYKIVREEWAGISGREE
ncbi:MAG: L,D-transpeptidase Cds6 family protein, partial [Pseudobdellovibrionaceae bacterium]